MDLELTDEQGLLAESVQQLLAKSSGPAAWPALVDFGVLALASDADGEVGAVELALVARAVRAGRSRCTRSRTSAAPPRCRGR